MLAAMEIQRMQSAVAQNTLWSAVLHIMTWSLVYVPRLLAPLLTFDEFNSVGMGSFQETEFYFLVVLWVLQLW